jgi:IS4 transposase
MAHLSQAVAHVKSALRRRMPAQLVAQAVQQSAYRFRRRTLGPAETVLLCLSMILAGNVSLAATRIGAGASFSAAALCRARARLSLLLLRVLNALLIQRTLKADGPPRVLLLDAVNYHLSDSRPLRRHYRHPRQKSRRGRRTDYPQMRVLSVVDLHTGLMLAQADFASDRHESPMLRRVLEACRPGDTLVFDRGFVSYANFCLLVARGIHFVARLPRSLQARQRGRRRFVHPGRRGSGQVLWEKPARRSVGVSRRQWRSLPAQLHLRQVSLKVSQGRCRGRLLLLSDRLECGARTLGRWYRRRWEIEGDFRHLKGTLKLEFFTTRSVGGVQRELLLRQLAYNLVREVMLHAASQQGVGCGRISFAEAARLLLEGQWALLGCLSIVPQRQRSTRPRRMKYRGKNYPVLLSRPKPQREIA